MPQPLIDKIEPWPGKLNYCPFYLSVVVVRHEDSDHSGNSGPGPGCPVSVSVDTGHYQDHWYTLTL